MAELELYGKVVNINNPFPPNNPHKQNIKTLYCKDSTNMQYLYKSAISSLSNNLQPHWMVELDLYGK